MRQCGRRQERGERAIRCTRWLARHNKLLNKLDILNSRPQRHRDLKEAWKEGSPLSVSVHYSPDDISPWLGSTLQDKMIPWWQLPPWCILGLECKAESSVEKGGSSKSWLACELRFSIPSWFLKAGQQFSHVTWLWTSKGTMIHRCLWSWNSWGMLASVQRWMAPNHVNALPNPTRFSSSFISLPSLTHHAPCPVCPLCL